MGVVEGGDVVRGIYGYIVWENTKILCVYVCLYVYMHSRMHVCIPLFFPVLWKGNPPNKLFCGEQRHLY